MYTTRVDDTPQITVSHGRHAVGYATDGSAPNPLEAFYAALAGCAAVYAKKACRGLGMPAAGIDIRCQPYAGPGGPLSLGRFKTEVRFPASFSAGQKAAILDSIAHCAVKEIVGDGAAIEFQVGEAAERS